MVKWVYGFGGGKAEGKADMKNLLGGKGANLAEMANLGLPVPPGFTITTEVCTYFYANGETYPKELAAQVDAALDQIGKLTNKGFGDTSNPLLVSVRSGARASMPGMMDTVLNLGLNALTSSLTGSAPGFSYGPNVFADPWGGMREFGGPVEAGKAYIVGEREPELFVPKQDGVILPSVPRAAREAQSGGQAAGTVVNHFHISTPDAKSFAQSRATVARTAGRLAAQASRYS